MAGNIADLRSVLHTGSISMAGLASLLSTLNIDDRSDHWVQKLLSRANHSDLQRLGHVIRLPMVDGPEFELDVIDPGKLINEMVTTSPAVAAMYSEAARRSPPSPSTPWHLVLGFDEFIPGDKLRTDPTRKTMVISVTFREFGQASMSNELMWHTIATIRSNVLKQVHIGTPSLAGLGSHFRDVPTPRRT